MLAAGADAGTGVSEAEDAAIRAAYEQSGELAAAAAIELVGAEEPIMVGEAEVCGAHVWIGERP